MQVLAFAIAAIVSVAVATPLVVSPAIADDASTPPLIPRSVLFGNPVRAAGELSSDGKWLSWEQPKDGVLNIFVAPFDDPGKARALTDEKKRPIAGYTWSADSSMIFYVQDNNGDENYSLYGVDVASGAQRTLASFKKARVNIAQLSHGIPGRILISVNNRDPRYFDIDSLDLKTGAMTPVFVNTEGFGGFLTDYDLNVRFAKKPLKNGGVEFYRVTGGKVEDKPFETVDYADADTTGPTGFSRDGKTLYWSDSRGRETAALIAQDVATGEKTVIAQDPRADVTGSTTDPRTRKIQAYAVTYLKNEWTVLDPAVAPDFAFLKSRFQEDFSIGSRTWADDKWLVSHHPVTGSSSTYLYDREAKTLKQLYVVQPALDDVRLAKMYPLELKSRDGLTLVSYLSLPPAADPQGTGRPTHPLPLVLDVHGGPNSRDGYGYNVLHQWLANRGYAVLSINFRGSTGLGKSFFRAGDLQWGAKMHDDLLDGIDWAVREKIADPKKIAIFGGSYGGYATLAGLAFTPDRFACGVDIVGPSNLETLLASIPPYWETERASLYRSVGNPTTPEGKAFLKSRSPLFKADAIKAPLLIGQGAHDPRVNVSESDSIAAALQAKNVPVTYVLFPDEGHGFGRPENSLAFFAIAEEFLSHCVGGRAEPIGNVLNASTAIVKTGADYIPGLPQALAERPPAKQ